MWSRRDWLKSGWLGLCAGAALSLLGERSLLAEDRANLKETLVFGLKPRLPEEEAFVVLVVAKVDSGDLPLEMVIATFRWAQGRKPYPFPYFERAMRLRAAQVGVTL